MTEQVVEVGAASTLLGSCSDEAGLVEWARTQHEAFVQLYDGYYSVVLDRSTIFMPTIPSTNSGTGIRRFDQSPSNRSRRSTDWLTK